MSSSPRRYIAHAVHDHGRGAHLVPEAASFVEAALLFTEHWHPASDDGGAVSVTVVDCDSGEQQCFSIDMESGDVGPCAA